MSDTVDKVGWHSPGTTFLLGKLDISESFQAMHHNGLHATVFGCVFDKIGTEKNVRHTVCEAVSNSSFCHTLKIFNATLNKVFDGDPGREPQRWVVKVQFGGRELNVFVNIVPGQGGMAGVDVRSGDCNTNRLWCILLICN